MNQNHSSRSDRSAPYCWMLPAWAAAALLFSGCSAFGVGGPQTYGVSDPPVLSPYNRSIQEPVPADDSQLGPASTIEPRSLYRPPTDIGPIAPVDELPADSSGQFSDEGTFGPQLLPPTFDDVAPEAERSLDGTSRAEAAPGTGRTEVILHVTAPERRNVGEAAVFTVVIRGGTGLEASGLVIEADFDEALTFPGHNEKRVRQPLGQLTAGGSREISLALTGRQAGRHCVRFSVLSGAGEVLVSRSSCVQFAAP